MATDQQSYYMGESPQMVNLESKQAISTIPRNLLQKVFILPVTLLCEQCIHALHIYFEIKIYM